MRLVFTAVFAVILALAAFGSWYFFLRDQAPTTLVVAAGERGSDSHTLMTEISEVLERHSETLRLDIRTSRTSSDAISRMNRGEVDLATVFNNTPAYTDIQLVADLFPDYFLLITRRQSPQDAQRNPFEGVLDLPFNRIAIPPSGTIDNFSFWSVIDHYKLPPEGIRTLPLSRERAGEAFLARRADAVFFVSSLRDPALLAFISDAGLRGIQLRFIGIDQAEAMQLKRPYLQPAQIVTGAFDGRQPLPDRDVTVPSLHRLLIARAGVSEDAVAELVSTIFSNRLDLLFRMPLSAQIKDPRIDGSVGLGLHPGAARYYDRDQPSFLQENAEPMALVITIMAMLASAGLALRRTLANRAKNRADTYNDDLLAIAARARHERDINELRTMRDELGALLERVVKALDEDRVTEEGFQSFSLLWTSVRETVNERVRDMRDIA